jgi:hypothetical protein
LTVQIEPRALQSSLHIIRIQPSPRLPQKSLNVILIQNLLAPLPRGFRQPRRHLFYPPPRFAWGDPLGGSRLLPEGGAVGRALRARPAGAEPLGIVDYLYLGQLANLLFTPVAWQHVSPRLGGASDGKRRLQSAIEQIAPVRNEIAHVREVDADRLARARLACVDVLGMLRSTT